MSSFKKCLFAAAAAAALSVVSGCATVVPCGAVYTKTTLPVSASTGSVSYSKTGYSTITSVLGLVAWGDGSIGAAARQGKISKVEMVDFNADSVFGVYTTYKTMVYGD